MTPVPDVRLDQTEIGLIVMGLNSIDDASLTEEGTAARAALAYKLGGAYADLILEAAFATGDPQ